MQYMKCAKYDKILNETISKSHQEFLDKNAEIIAYITKHIGKVSKIEKDNFFLMCIICSNVAGSNILG